MTCIVGIVSQNGVLLGADSLASSGSVKEEALTPKLTGIVVSQAVDDHKSVPIKLGIGYTSSYRMGDLLKYSFDPPDIEKDQDANEYLVKLFIPELIACFDKHHFTKTSSGVKEGGEFLVALKNRLFIVQSDFSVLEPSAGYSSVGSGSTVALGALYACNAVNTPVSDAMSIVLAAASEFTTSVGGRISTLLVTDSPE